MIYCFDTSSFIDLSRRYPIDLFPSLWEKLKLFSEMDPPQIISVKTIRDECNHLEPKLKLWLKSLGKIFYDDFYFLLEYQNVCGKIVDYKRLVKGNPDYSDALIVTLAKAAPLHFIVEPEEIMLINEENKKRKRDPITKCIKIPEACRRLGIRSGNLLNFFREEKFIFLLE